MKFQDLVQENGLVTRDGKTFIDKHVLSHIETLLNSFEEELTEQQIMALSAVMMKAVGDCMSHKLFEKTKLDKMSDKEFFDYMRVKYGSSYKTIGFLERCDLFRMTKVTEAGFLEDMTDEEFNLYLDNKYGKDRLLTKLTEAELARCPKISDEELQKVMDRATKERNGGPIPHVNVDIRFK